MTFLQTIDDGPPRDVKMEERFLSAMILLRPVELYGVDCWCFYDPFHSWVFRHTHHQSDPIGHLMSVPRPQWIPKDLAYSVAHLFVQRDGKLKSGLAVEYRYYCKQLVDLRNRRFAFDEGMKLIQEAIG